MQARQQLNPSRRFHMQLHRGPPQCLRSCSIPKQPFRSAQHEIHRTRHVSRKARKPTLTSEEAVQPIQEQQHESTGFSSVVQRLLHRAASSLTRGTTTCLTCRGQGTCTCPSCNGTGVTERDARQNAMRHTAQKLRSVLHVERSEYHSDWLTSNRCRRCHGTGAMICPTCQGLGTRHASKPDKAPG